MAELSLAAIALVFVTCAGAARGPSSNASSRDRMPAHTPPPPSAAREVKAPAPPATPASGRGSEPASVPVPNERRLTHLYAGLKALSEHRRTEPVRILWLGDSHAAADFWPDAVRKPLGERYGVGGPGFVHVGVTAYRHSGFKLGREGSWRVEPRQPSSWLRQNDGVFGLGGIRAVPGDATARATVSLSGDAVQGDAHWDLAFRLPGPRARFRVKAEGLPTLIVDGKTFPVGTMAHAEWQTKPGATVSVDAAANEPELFGVVVESTKPGVVVDTLGINGARIGTPLSWEEAPWIFEVKRRNPSLVVIAYGTNEVGDQVAPHRYGPDLESLVARVRRAAPESDCLVVGPTDRAAPDWTTLPRVAEIDVVLQETAERAGCAYFSTWRSMGGEGSLKRWLDLSPPFATPDHVHLTPRGYAELGSAMSQVLLGASPR